MEFGQRIKDARIQRKLTQDQIAEKLFVTRQTISNWEHEKSYPDIASLIRLSDYYHISLDTLLKEDTGMREYLEKKEIKNNIGPVYNVLLIVELILVSMSVIGHVTKHNWVNGNLDWILTILLFLVAYAVFKLRKFDEYNSLKIMPKVQKQVIRYNYIVPTMFIIVGVILIAFHIITTGIGFISIGGLISLILIIKRKI